MLSDSIMVLLRSLLCHLEGVLTLCDTQSDTGHASFIKIVFMLWTLHSII